MSKLEEMLKELGDGVETQTRELDSTKADLAKVKAAMADDGKSREELAGEAKALKERCDKLEGAIKDMSEAHDKLTRQFGGDDDSRTRRDPGYHNPVRGRRFPNQRAAAAFAYAVGAGIFRDSVCLERCEQMGVPVTYERGNGQTVDVLKTRDLQVTSDQDGGYAVQADAMMVIWDVADEYGAYNDATVVPMMSLEKTILLPNDGVEMYFVDELSAALKSGVTFSKAVLKAKKVGGYAMWSSEFSEDVAAFAGEQLAALFGTALARKMDRCVFTGDGTGAYGGIVGVLANADIALESMPDTKTSIEDVTADDLLKLKYAVPSRIRKLASECAFYIHPDVFFVIEGLKDQYDRYILSDAKEGAERRLWGYPVREIESYPDLADDAAGLAFVSFGSLRRSYAVGMRRQLRIRKVSELFALEDAEALIAFARFDAQCFNAGNMANMQTAAA